MTSTLCHRGPDGWGLYISKHIALGHTRLSIIDLAYGAQPMMTDRFVISFNGEIYNYIELRRELLKKGAVFRTKSDTEVILKAFDIYGTNAISMFNGQFAFLLWDKAKNRLIAARDRYGIRPLYILEHKKTFYFCSELKGFDTIKSFDRSFDLKNLFEHGLLWNTLGDKTVFCNIRSLPAGTIEIYNNTGSFRNRRYYEIGESEGTSPKDFSTAMQEFSELLNDSVRLRLRSDVPVANYLSGGIDSSVVTLLTRQNNRKFHKTFSVSFDDPLFDESKFQKEMVAHLHSEHIDRKISYDSINNSFFDACYHFERPVFRTAPVPLYLLSNDVRENGIKVVLTGEAADEILYGYDSYKELSLLNFWSKHPNSRLRPMLIRRLYPHLMHYSDPKRYGLMRMYYEGFLKKFDNPLVGLNIRVKNNKIIQNIFNKDDNKELVYDNTLDHLKSILPSNFKNWTLLQRNQFLEMKTLLSGYLLSSQGDRMSMAHSVESRYPFLDHRLVEKIFHFKDSFKLYGFSEKYLLKKSYENLIPKPIINRPKMPYQAPDLKSFFSGGKLSEKTRYFLSDKIVKDYGIFDHNYVRRFVEKCEKRGYENAGYRDNMLITFILSAQMSNYHIKHPPKKRLDNSLKKIEIID